MFLKRQQEVALQLTNGQLFWDEHTSAQNPGWEGAGHSCGTLTTLCDLDTCSRLTGAEREQKLIFPMVKLLPGASQQNEQAEIQNYVLLVVSAVNYI